jgi:predicted Zn-dependent protease
VIYLYPTEYDARGAKYFFEKIISQGSSSPPEFLSTHPNPDNRIVNIENEWNALGSKTGQTFQQRYQDFKNSLP